MIIKPEELKQNGYELLDKLDHKELIPFAKYMTKIQRYLYMIDS